MAAIAAPRQFPNEPPTSSRMSSPKDVKKNNLPPKPEGSSRHASPHLANIGSRQPSPPQPVQPPDFVPETTQQAQREGDSKPATSNAQPLGPPPKPNTTGTDGDYFNQNHNPSHFQLEPNPFEAQFGQPSAETPGKSLLPPVASLTSPSSLLPGGTPGWAESLRAGPLSPAMLPGPTGGSDYFGQSFRGSFPTPNESSLRTGLTPGGGGSMFPAPSPNSQLILNNLQSGGATPGTIDFHRTALNAAAAAKTNNNLQIPTSNGPTSQPESNNQFAAMDQKPFQPQNQRQQQQGDPFGQHDANDAANGLYMLAQANGARNANQFAVPGQPAQIQTGMNHVNNNMGNQSQETSPLSRRGANNNSIGSISGSVETGDVSDSGHSEQAKPTTRSRGGKKGAANGKTNNRRKADDMSIKTPANKKAKANSGGPVLPEDDSDEDESLMADEINGKKMTDEEKRKNFLERNRVAALKCRQRKKQWLQNLQNKVEIYSAENDALSGQVQQLREEIVNLKTLLLAHKDCPVASSQGLGGVNMHSFLEQNSQAQANPYGLGVPNGMAGVPHMSMPGPMGQGQPQMQRT